MSAVLPQSRMPEGPTSRRDTSVWFKPTDEVLNAYLTRTPMAHALHRTAEAHQLAKIALPGPILELGCGTGQFASLALKGRIDVDVDRNARVLDKARRTGRYGTVACADARRLPFGDGQFQTVLAVSVLEHIPQPGRALTEAFRVLRPGGRLVATVVLADLHRHLFYPRLLRCLGGSRLADSYCRVQDRLLRHCSLMARAAREELLRDAGFGAVGSRPILTPRLTATWDQLLLSALPFRMGLRFAWHPRWFRRLAVHCCRDLVRERSDEGSNLLVAARKPLEFARLCRRGSVPETTNRTVCHVCVPC